MLLVLFSLTAVLYGMACCVFLADLASEDGALGRFPMAKVLAAALVVHVAFLVAVAADTGAVPFSTIHQTLNVASLLIAGGYLVALLRLRVTTLGGFVLPVTLLFFLGAGLSSTTVRVSNDIRDIVLPIHVGINVLGIVSISLAFSVAAAYLLQDHLLRQKRVRGLFLRLPALDRLDTLHSWLATLGFLLLTGGLLSGVLFSVRGGGSVAALTVTQILAIVSWLVFGANLFMRRNAGWRGRRGALGTLIGFALTTAVLTGYLLRAGSVG